MWVDILNMLRHLYPVVILHELLDFILLSENHLFNVCSFFSKRESQLWQLALFLFLTVEFREYFIVFIFIDAAFLVTWWFDQVLSSLGNWGW